MAPSVLLQTVILVFKGEVLLFWGVTVYSSVWYGWTYRKRAIQILSTLAGWMCRVARHLARISVVGLFLLFLCFLGILIGLYQQAGVDSRHNGDSMSSSAPSFNNAMSEALPSLAACPIQVDPAYSRKHEIDLLEETNAAISSINHSPLLAAASAHDRTSKHLIAAQEETRRSYTHARETVIPIWLDMQKNGIYKEHLEAFQTALTALKVQQESCRAILYKVLGNNGTADRLWNEVAELRRTAQLRMDQAMSGDVHLPQDRNVRNAAEMLKNAGERLRVLRAMLSEVACFDEQVGALEKEWELMSN